MSDLIDREYAIKKFCEYGTYLERHGVPIMTLCDAKQRAVDLIESLPSAQLQGKWIEDNLINEMYDCLMLANCSVCGYQMDVRHERGYFRYCPNCGARMDGESK